MRSFRSLLLVVLALGLVLVIRGGAATARATPQKSEVPLILRVLGVRVGKDTIETLERKIGPGEPCMGGHPHGGRAWFIKNHGLYVYADGFDYDSKGNRIIDTLVISTKKDDLYDFDYEHPRHDIPRISISRAGVGWLGKVVPGMSKDQVLRLTGSLPKPVKKGQTLRWTMSGIFRTGTEQNRLHWDATLTFAKDVLTKIDVSVGDR